MAPIRLVTSKPRKKIAKRQLELRDRLWPDLKADELWSRHEYNGFTTLPKAMPLMMSIMDDLAGGQPVSSTYLELWCRTFDESFVTLSKPREIAFHSGFTGQRAERMWKSRLKILSDLGFIKVESGPSGPYSYALLMNPYRVIKALYESKTTGVTKDKYNALIERMIEIDDESLSPPKPAPVVAAPPAKTLAEAMAALSVAPVPASSLSAAAPIPMPPQQSAVAVPSVPPQNLETTLDELPK
ncbi:hypothetical protein [Rhizobium rhizogenes]|uniref:hypothetical protein n=1 Tax=Rhizobium rhizogenes TaxID=359 RepID=UPI001574181A|nr:hypothetical protein [Rhizobium rhizogenes]